MENTFNINEKDRQYAGLSPQARIADAQVHFGDKLTIAFSGAEDVILIDMAVRNETSFSVFCLDTGRLHQETHDFIDRVRTYYNIAIQMFVPDLKLLEPFVNRNGLNSFYKDGHTECCAIRKVEPLARALVNKTAWVTGLRHDQSPTTRTGMAYIEPDPHHRDANGNHLVKINPLLDWTSEQVWTYIRDNDIPYNALHDRGYKSIGCIPCTRPSRPGEHERMARWWWEASAMKECGLHR